MKKFSDYIDIRTEVKRSNAMHRRLESRAFLFGSSLDHIYHREIRYWQAKNNRILTTIEKAQLRDSIKERYNLKPSGLKT